MTERLRATYLVETPVGLLAAAEAIAGEQSSGTFVPVPGETPSLQARHRATVEHVRLLETRPTPSLPGARPPGVSYQYGEVTLSFPADNIGTNVQALLATVLGNLFELSQVSGLRLTDVEFPASYAQAFAGPRFGIAGTRALTGVSGRPLIGTIVKPSVGLSPAETAALVGTLARAGIDFIKDDELMANPPHSPLPERVRHVMQAIERAADQTGRKVMYAFNISDEADAMRRHHDLVVAAGGTCVMASLNAVGTSAMQSLCQHTQVPVHGHRNGWGLMTRHPALGLSFEAYQKLWRLVGVDHLHVNGLRNKFWEPDDSVVASVRACLTPLLGGFGCLPVLSSGQWGGQAPETYRRTHTTDLLYLAGGGILAHPGGPAAGVTALRQAWEAAVNGIPLQEYARSRPELQGALDTFGARA